MYPQNQVTVRSSETGDVFQMNRKVAETHDTLTILDDEKAAPAQKRKRTTRDKSAKPADQIAAPVADDN